MKRHVLLALKVAVSTSLLALILLRIDWSEMGRIVMRSDARLLAGAMALACTNMALTTLRWALLVWSRQERRPAFGLLLEHAVVGHFYNVVLPGGVAGDVVRGHRMRRFDMSGSSAYGSVIADRMLGLLSLMVLAVGGSLLFASGAPQAGPIDVLPYLYAAAVAAAFLFLSPPARRAVSAWAPRRFELVRRLMRLYDAVADYASRRAFWLALGLSLVTSLLLVALMALLASAMGIPVDPRQLLWMVPTVGLLSSIPVSFSGWGIREAGYVFFLERLGVSTEQALALSVAFGLVIVLLGAVGGVWHLAASLRPALADRAPSAGPDPAALSRRHA